LEISQIGIRGIVNFTISQLFFPLASEPEKNFFITENIGKEKNEGSWAKEIAANLNFSMNTDIF